MIKIGVLELQGNFAMHHKIFQDIGIHSISVKKPVDLNEIDGLVIPGGESTTISLLIDSYGMNEPLVDFGRSFPVLGTCAGLIMMAKNVNDKRIRPLGLVDITVERNAYGRQIESRTENIKFNFTDKHHFKLLTTLIRAPKIRKISGDVQVIGRYEDSPIAILSGHHLCLSFHPELDQIDIFHRVLFDSKSELYYKKISQYHVA